jgi:hypothetical protein
MKRNSLILHKIRWCLTFFNFLGFENSYRYDAVVRYLLLFLVLSIFCFNGVIRIVDLTLNVKYDQLVHIVIGWFYLIGSSFKGFTCVLQSFTKVKVFEKFFSKISEVDDLIRNETNILINYKLIQLKLSITIICSVVFYAICYGYIIHSFYQNQIAFRVILPYHLPIIVIQIYIQKYIFAIQILQCYIQLLKNVLISIKSYQFMLQSRNSFAGWRIKARQNHLKVAVAGRAYELLWESSKLINESFDETILMQLSMSFITMLNFGFVVITTLKIGVISTLLRQFVLIFMNCMSLFLLHFHTQQCLNDVHINNLCKVLIKVLTK